MSHQSPRWIEDEDRMARGEPWVRAFDESMDDIPTLPDERHCIRGDPDPGHRGRIVR